MMRQECGKWYEDVLERVLLEGCRGCLEVTMVSFVIIL